VNVIVSRADALPAPHVRLWTEWQRANEELHSPFLRPEFTQHVAAVCPDVEVAVLEQDGEPAGFFPYCRSRPGVGTPVGGPFCDLQGVVARPGTVWDAQRLLRGARLKAWHFHHLVASQGPLRPYHYCECPSYYMDLSGGYDGYCAERSRAGSQRIRRMLQRSRKIAREVGPLRFVPHTADGQVFETLVRWKVEHYRRIGAINYLGYDWARKLLPRLVDLNDDCFRGMLSALYCGDRLAAVHLGLRSCEVLHSWFPTYDPELADYSPGSVFFLLLAQEMPALGIQRIDLGRGDEQFKLSLGSGTVPVAQGSVDLRPVARLCRRSSFRFFRWLRASRLRTPAKTAGRLVPSLRRWATFHE
jgi:CelD/BcsL family acetyltransferase involved in cellulose biosynthesis